MTYVHKLPHSSVIRFSGFPNLAEMPAPRLPKLARDIPLS